ncbi:MAG: SDR family NAD(P)-dependent oxidoreductase [Microcella sp.]|uniref:SDR family NAD(P)-dependent oxidoreductase n=1 Tax=Microcella sp. TaxID=1913979 RepID=UPI003315943A
MAETRSGRLQGKRALVTGAGSGIGRATALRFAEEGAFVALLDVNSTSIEDARHSFPDPDKALALEADITDEAAMAAVVDTVVSAWGGLDIAIVNAGVQDFASDGPAHELSMETWHRTININLTGSFITARACVSAMLATGGGSIVFTLSPTGSYGMAKGFDAYSASKGGVGALMRVMANDYAEHGIRVNGVMPGFTDTPLVADMTSQPASTEAFLAGNPIKRPGRASEVASAMVFLASDESSYSAGSVLVVDGGLTAV